MAAGSPTHSIPLAHAGSLRENCAFTLQTCTVIQTLILGGTAWLGGTLATAVLAPGHEVVCLARSMYVPSGVRLVRADRTTTNALSRVRDLRWDTVIDVAAEPGRVCPRHVNSLK